MEASILRRAMTLLGVVLSLTVLGAALASCSGDGGKEDAAEFCSKYRSAVGGFSSIESLDLADTDSVDKAIAEFDELARLAPGSIDTAVNDVAKVWKAVLSDLAGTAPAARDEALIGYQQQLADVADAAEQMNSFAARECQVGPAQAATPTPTPTPLAIEG